MDFAMLVLEAILIATSLLPSSFGNELNRNLVYEPRLRPCSSFIDAKIPRDLYGTVDTSTPLNAKAVIAASSQRIFPYNEVRGLVQWTRLRHRGILNFAPLLLFSSPGQNMFDQSTDPLIRSDRTMILRTRNRIEKDAALGRTPKFVVTKTEDFDNVIEACARQPRYMHYRKAHNWISPDFVRTYKELNRRGLAYARGIYVDGKLAAGFYGLYIDGSITGESMFHVPEAGGKNLLKYLLVDFVEEMNAHGHHDMDTQVVAGLIAKYGGYPLEDELFELRNARLKAADLDFPDLPRVAEDVPRFAAE